MRPNIEKLQEAIEKLTGSANINENQTLFLTSLAKSMSAVVQAEEAMKAENRSLSIERLNQTLSVLSMMIGTLESVSFKKFTNSIHEQGSGRSGVLIKLCIFVNAFSHICLIKQMLALGYDDEARVHLDSFWKEINYVLN